MEQSENKQVPLVIDLSHFSEDSPLRTFFNDGEDAITAANDGRYETRVKWANLLQSFKNLDAYYDADNIYKGLKGDFSNTIKMLAALFTGYDENPEVKQLIEEINSKKFSNEKLKNNFVKYLKVFLKIRKDIKLERIIEIYNKNGNILIRPAATNNIDDLVKTSNSIIFKICDSHSECNHIPILPNTILQTTSHNWIEELYQAPEKAIKGWSFYDGFLFLNYDYNLKFILEYYQETFQNYIENESYIDVIGNIIIINLDNGLSLEYLTKLQNNSNINKNLKKLCKYIVAHGTKLDLIMKAAKFLWIQGENFSECIRKPNYNPSVAYNQFYRNKRLIDLILFRIFAYSEEAQLFDKLMMERYYECEAHYNSTSFDSEVQKKLNKEKSNIDNCYKEVIYWEKYFKSQNRNFQPEPISKEIESIFNPLASSKEIESIVTALDIVVSDDDDFNFNEDSQQDDY